MRFQHVLTRLAVALCCADGVVGRQGYLRRQDSTDIATSTGDGSSGSPATSAVQSSDGSTSQRESSTASPTSSGSKPSSSATDERSSFTTSTSTPTTSGQNQDGTPTSIAPPVAALNTTTPDANATDKDTLPIQPTITPAIGIAGVFLLATGVALCLIGIKHDWLYIFLSTALLASLAVTVLIIYVMPASGVSNAIQGAYLVAIVITGLVFGAVSLVFKEVTDGLGCLLGSFCFAMWLLVLSPGGIIKSTAGRGVFIGVFCVVGFGFSFSRYTRNYALILCTAFAGAMITILGVDCFSRAGLKEFWIYLWDLNDNEFPLGTTTYPITRGIRVEIACTIVVFIMGVMSQFKIWKIIKARRAKREIERQQDQADRDQLESEVGKEIEDANQRDREQWEAVYGDKNTARVHTDSGVGSSVETFGKEHGSVREVDAIELADVPESQSRRTSKRSSKPSVLVRATSDDRATPNAEQSREALLGHEKASEPPSRSTSNRQSYTSVATHDHAYSATPSTTEYAPGAPAVTPLPFNLPVEETDAPARDVGADGESIAPHESVADAMFEHPAVPLKQFSLAQLNAQFGAMAPRVEADRASSIAATADEDVDVDAMSNNRLSIVPQAAAKRQNDSTRLAAGTEDAKRLSRVSLAQTLPESALEEDDEEMLARSTPAKAEPAADDHNGELSGAAGSVLPSAASRRSSVHAASEAGPNASVSEGLVGQLPPKLSKIAMTYRTNEWAKHIADADMPEDEEPPRAHSPGVQVDTAFAQEAAKPVDVDALRETATTTEAAELGRKISQASVQKPKEKKSKPSLSRNSSRQSVTPIYAFGGRSSSQMSLRRQDSDANSPKRPQLATAGMRSSSTPLLNQTLVESPVEGTLAANDPYRIVSPTEDGAPGNLMDQRNTILKRKPTSTSFNALYTAAPNVNVVAPSESGIDQGIIHEEATSPEDRPRPSEDMTLAQRRELMQQQRRASNPPHPQPESRSASRLDIATPLPQPGRYTPISPSNEAVIYDSHQPKRTSTVNKAQQVARLTQWRQSLQQGSSSDARPTVMEDTARQAMLESQRREEYAREKRRQERSQRKSYMDAAMRSGQLHGAHRDALRRMQAKANRDSKA